MFKRPRCKKCNEKISKKYIYCPYCGFCQKDNATDLFEPALNNLGFPFSFLFKKLTKDLEKQLSQIEEQEPTLDEQNENPIKGFPGGTMGVSINIDTKNGQPVIKINPMDKNKKSHPEPMKSNVPNKEIPMEKIEKFSNLPKEEPETQVTRLTNKLVYEINLPGVQKEDIIIRKLENSIEIKAYSENKAYFKLIPLALPLLRSDLKEGKLTLELKI